MTAPAQAPDVPRNKAVAAVVTGLAAAGALVGALWAWLAPPINGVIALTRSGDRVKAYLGAESDNWFTSAFLVVGMLSVLAVVAAVLVWQWKSHRGPAMVAALSVGSVAAASTAAPSAGWLPTARPAFRWRSAPSPCAAPRRRSMSGAR